MRTALGIASGGAVILSTLAVCFLLLFLILGPERALAGSTLEFTTLWLGIAMVVCLAAATAGGWVADMIGQRRSAVIGLAVLVLVLGLLDAGLHTLAGPAPAVDYGRLGLIDWIIGLREPAWYDWSMPPVMALFVWVAGSSRAIERDSAENHPGR